MSSNLLLDGWDEVGKIFDLDADHLAQLKKNRLLIACEDSGGYEGYAFVLYEENGQLMEVESSHCSCDGFYWSPEYTSLAYYWKWFMDVRTGKAKGSNVKFECFEDIVKAINEYAKSTA